MEMSKQLLKTQAFFFKANHVGMISRLLPPPSKGTCPPAFGGTEKAHVYGCFPSLGFLLVLLCASDLVPLLFLSQTCNFLPWPQFLVE
jgi:hypothetical protein